MTSKTKKPELPIIAGCLEGLTGYLVNFTQSVEEGTKKVTEKDLFMHPVGSAKLSIFSKKFTFGV